MKKIIFTLIFIFTGCSFTMSPPVAHDYIPLYPDTTGVTYGKINLYLWPLEAKGIRPYHDTTLLFIDSHGNSINIGYYHPVVPPSHFKIGVNTYFTLGVIRLGAYDTVAPIYDYAAYTGLGIRILPHYTFKHFIFGAYFNPIALGFWLPVTDDSGATNISGISALPEMFYYTGLYAYYTTSFSKNTKFYIGPQTCLYPFTKSAALNSGICFYKEGKERVRIGFSTAYYEDPVYERYNLFPLAFMFSVWKTF